MSSKEKEESKKKRKLTSYYWLWQKKDGYKHPEIKASELNFEEFHATQTIPIV